MADDIIKQLAYYALNETHMPAGLVRDIIEEIERLRSELSVVRRHFLQVESALSDIEHLTSDRNVLHRIKEARRG